MEKHKCKLCFRSFSNGRALGGHMRSHMMNLPLPTKPEEESSRTVQLNFEAETAPSSSSSSSSSSEDEGGGGGDDKGLSYGLRENPKMSIRLVDPEFSFAAADTVSVILQDRESETESSRNNPTRRRSKRAWKLGAFDYHNKKNKKEVHDHEHEAMMKKANLCKASNTETWVDHEPVSSVSDATTEEDVAFCLMMLSRDKWKRQKDQQVLVEDPYQEEEEEEKEEEDEDEEDEAERSLEDSDDESEDLKVSKNRVRGRYKCETCNKVFRSYQALGGHRASHKKIKVSITVEEPESEHENNGGACASAVVEKKIHECPVCFRVFASGQALGGHKRTHVTGSASNPVPSSTKLGNNKLIDLNLPAPIDDDDISQIENSAVSDAEFVRTR